MRNYPGIIAVILAVFLGLGWLGVIAASIYFKRPLGEDLARALGQVGSAFSSAIGAYIGIAIHQRRNGKDGDS